MAAVTVSSVRVPVPVSAALIAGLALLRMVKLLAPIVCAPATVIAPLADWIRKLSFHDAAFRLMAPVPAVEPIVINPQPLVILASSAVVRL